MYHNTLCEQKLELRFSLALAVMSHRYGCASITYKNDLYCTILAQDSMYH
jgi:hypothetical protein